MISCKKSRRPQTPGRCWRSVILVVKSAGSAGVGGPWVWPMATVGGIASWATVGVLKVGDVVDLVLRSELVGEIDSETVDVATVGEIHGAIRG